MHHMDPVLNVVLVVSAQSCTVESRPQVTLSASQISKMNRSYEFLDLLGPRQFIGAV